MTFILLWDIIGYKLKKENDPFGFNKAINWDKLEDPKVLKELEEMFKEEEKKKEEKWTINKNK